MVGDRFGNQSVQVRITWRRHPRGALVSSGSTVATAFAPALARSLGSSLVADADYGLHRRQLENGACAGLVVRGWHVWFPPSAF